MQKQTTLRALPIIKSRIEELSKSEKEVASWLLFHPREIRFLSMAEIAGICGVSDTTVLRMCKKLGFNGFSDLKITILQDIVLPTQLIHDDVSNDDDPITIARKVFTTDVQCLYDTMDMMKTEDINLAINTIKNAESVLVIGMGNSGLLAQHAYQLFRRLGINCTAPFDTHIQLIEASLQTEKDLTIGISFSGDSSDVISTMQTAKKHGAKTIAITGNAGSPLATISDLVMLSIVHKSRLDSVTGRIAQIAIIDSLYANLAMMDFEENEAREKLISSSLLQKFD